MVGPEGIEPSSPPCHSSVLAVELWSFVSMVGNKGVEPFLTRCKRGVRADTLISLGVNNRIRTRITFVRSEEHFHYAMLTGTHGWNRTSFLEFVALDFSIKLRGLGSESRY